MEPVTLTTERLVLRPFGPGDAAAVHAACQDPDIPRWTSVPSPYGLGDAVDFVGRSCPEGWRADTGYAFAMISKADGALTGCMALLRLALLHAPERQAELGYWTVKEHRGRGYTVEAAREIVRWAFTGLGVERLEWFAEAGNEGSRAVALKVGFQMEGTARAKIPHQGTRRDAWCASLLPSDLGLGSATPYLPYPG
ncbi:GNAT family N-acetyltransferase [Streptomyces sp. MST-110588]|uniref:GNAT family N-acetyltransferase n=1 Tax=Streptomyces sp. MST-110588 TaxID=2833628 RepID=UPI001F5D50AA|nr:GNAT family N-acetyltransferase [Streptomyces sp. MST-110588]UNO41717.1 GNAT family N-acetyltransferase [Streptomyces sp. MST-110588]